MKKTKRISNSFIIFCLLFLFFFSVGTTSNSLVESNANGSTTVTLQSRNQIAYTPHEPIVIDDDTDFETQGWEGHGNETDPYIIENLWIEQNVTGGSCIHISGTTSFFKIQNCFFNSSFPEGYGIRLNTVDNGIIENNTLDGLQWAIYSYTAVDGLITIKGNRVYTSEWAVTSFSYSSSTSISFIVTNNTIEDCNLGIYVRGVVRIFNNTCIEGAIGISLYPAISGIVRNNTCVGQSTAIELRMGTGYTLVENNTISGNSGCGLEIDSPSANNTVIWNTFVDGHSYTQDDGVNNTFRYNYWDDYTMYDADEDGFGDTPYSIGGSAGSVDDYPRGPIGSLVVDWQGGVWINETTYNQTAIFAVDCQYYVFTPSIVHTDLETTFTGQMGNISAGQASVIIHVEDRFFGASILFNTTSAGIAPVWYPDIFPAGVTSYPPVETVGTISFTNRYDCRSFWAFAIDGVIRETGIVNDSIYSVQYLTLTFNKDLSLGVHSYSFNITTNLVYDYNWNIRTGTYTVLEETSPPIYLSSPSDIEFFEGDLGNNITWTVTSGNIETYELYQNGSLLISGIWIDPTYSINVDHLAVGTYNYTIVVGNADHTVIDTVWIFVHQETPTITQTTELPDIVPLITNVIIIGSISVIIIFTVSTYRAKKTKG